MAWIIAMDAGFGVKGLWLGFALGEMIMFFLYALILRGTNWETMIRKIRA